MWIDNNSGSVGFKGRFDYFGKIIEQYVVPEYWNWSRHQDRGCGSQSKKKSGNLRDQIIFYVVILENYRQDCRREPGKFRTAEMEHFYCLGV